MERKHSAVEKVPLHKHSNLLQQRLLEFLGQWQFIFVDIDRFGGDTVYITDIDYVALVDPTKTMIRNKTLNMIKLCT